MPWRGSEFFRRIGYRIYCDVRFIASRLKQRLLHRRGKSPSPAPDRHDEQAKSKPVVPLK